MLHNAITAAAVLDREIVTQIVTGAPLDAIGGLIDARAAHQHDAARLNVEIAVEVQDRNVVRFLELQEELFARYGAARTREYEDIRAILLSQAGRVDHLAQTVAAQAQDLADLRAHVARLDARIARVEALHGGD